MASTSEPLMVSWGRWGISVATLSCCFVLLLQQAELRLSHCPIDSAKTTSGDNMHLMEVVHRLRSSVEELASEMKRKNAEHLAELRAMRAELSGTLPSTLATKLRAVASFQSNTSVEHVAQNSSPPCPEDGNVVQAAWPPDGSGTSAPAVTTRPPSVVTTTPLAQFLADVDRRSAVGQALAREPAVPTFVVEVERKAEGQYWYQRKEKNEPVHPAFVRYGANWPCIWGEELTGTSIGEGSKWTCGVRLLSKPCVVYSFGSRGDIAFEHGVVQLGSSCEIYIYDPTANEPVQARNLGLKYYKIGLGVTDGNEILGSAQVRHPVRSLRSLMRQNNHDFLDILKIDIDFFEHSVIAALDASGWPSVAQLLLEVHIEQQSYNGQSLDKLVNLVEKAGFRLFHHEVNWEYGATCCIEYAFIQKAWRPGKRNYEMKSDTLDVPLRPHPQHQFLVDKYLKGHERQVR